MGHSQLEDINEIHVRNPNYKSKNYDPNYQAKKAEANKQQQQFSTANRNQYKAPYTKLATNNNTSNLASSLDIAGEVTLKTSVCKVPFAGFCRVWAFYQSSCCLHKFFLVFSFRGVRFCLGNGCERCARRDLC